MQNPTTGDKKWITSMVLGNITRMLFSAWRFSYAFFDYFNESKQKSVATFTETASDTENVQQVSIETVDQKGQEVAQETDRVALIKEVQQKVFTVLLQTDQDQVSLQKRRLCYNECARCRRRNRCNCTQFKGQEY